MTEATLKASVSRLTKCRLGYLADTSGSTRSPLTEYDDYLLGSHYSNGCRVQISENSCFKHK